VGGGSAADETPMSTAALRPAATRMVGAALAPASASTLGPASAPAGAALPAPLQNPASLSTLTQPGEIFAEKKSNSSSNRVEASSPGTGMSPQKAAYIAVGVIAGVVVVTGVTTAAVLMRRSPAS
jgi:hypothetical protein